MVQSEKGFGFVELSDGSGDGFIHESVLVASAPCSPVKPSKYACVRDIKAHT